MDWEVKGFEKVPVKGMVTLIDLGAKKCPEGLFLNEHVSLHGSNLCIPANW